MLQFARRKPRVYVAGPMALGDRAANLRAAIDAAETLLQSGCVPFIPQFGYAWGDVYPHTHEQWLAYDFEWVKVCDALLRLPGESKGADMEVSFCLARGIPVFRSIPALLEWVYRA